MSSTKSSTSGEAKVASREGFKTHSPEMYANNGSKVTKYFNLKVLDLLQMCFNNEAGGKKQFLDIGCGIGDFTREELLPRCLPCKRIVATDVSEDMVEYAKKNFSHEKIVYDILDIGQDVTSFAETYGQFDRVYSFFCLHWVKDKELVMSNISRLLTPGGECVLLFAVGSHAAYNWKLLGEMKRWKPYKDVLDSFSTDIPGAVSKNEILNYFSNVFKRANLVPQTCEVLYKPPALLDMEATIRLQLSVNPIVPHLSESEKMELTKDLSEIIRSNWNEEPRKKAQHGVLLLVHARKPEA